MSRNIHKNIKTYILLFRKTEFAEIKDVVNAMNNKYKSKKL